MSVAPLVQRASGERRLEVLVLGSGERVKAQRVSRQRLCDVLLRCGATVEVRLLARLSLGQHPAECRHNAQKNSIARRP